MYRRKIYAAGSMENVSVTEATFWRNKARNLLPEWDFLDPCRRLHSNKEKEMRSIFELDLRDIREADCVLVNLNDPKVAKHGTAMEVFYASYVLHKPVVAFKAKKDHIHPFLEQVVTEWFATLEDACDALNSKYL